VGIGVLGGVVEMGNDWLAPAVRVAKKDRERVAYILGSACVRKLLKEPSPETAPSASTILDAVREHLTPSVDVVLYRLCECI